MNNLPPPKGLDPRELDDALRHAPPVVLQAIANLYSHVTFLEARNAELEEQIRQGMQIQRRQKALADELMERVVALTAALAVTDDAPPTKPGEASALEQQTRDLLQRLKKGSSS